MKIEVSFYAGLRERLKTESEVIELPEEACLVSDAREYLANRGDAWAENLGTEQQVLAAVNEAMATLDHQLQSGDKLAFFPPVSGG